MRIFITGGAGFIGRALATRLLAAGHEVTGLDNLSPQIHGELPVISLPPRMTFLREDIRNLAQRHDVLEGFDVVYHLAAETGTGQSMYKIAHYVDVNECGTAALLEAIARCKKKPTQIILGSSRAIYGEGAFVDARDPDRLVQPMPRTREKLAAHDWDHRSEDGYHLVPIATPERLPTSPSSVYAATKMSQELLISAAAEGLGLKATIFRFQNVYGEGQSLQNPYTGIISIFFNRARQGLPLSIYEDGMPSRDFVHIEDVVNALVLPISSAKPSGSIYNVGSGVSTSILDLAKTLLQVSGYGVPVEVSGQYRIGDIRHCFADLGLIKQDFNFVPQVDLKDGLLRFVAWAETQDTYRDKSDVAADELRQRGLGTK